MARIRIFEKVATYTMLFSPCVAYYLYYAKDQDERKEQVSFMYMIIIEAYLGI